MKNWYWLLLIAVVVLSGVVAGGISFGDNEGAKAPSVAQTAQKLQGIRMPFIANQGQVDEEVRFYAKTFGGTVFVTKDGEIVYSLFSLSGGVAGDCYTYYANRSVQTRFMPVTGRSGN